MSFNVKEVDINFNSDIIRAAEEMLYIDQYIILDKIKLVMIKYLGNTIEYKETRYYITEPTDFFSMPMRLKFLLLANV